jgi:hypothetical protein
MLGDLEHAQFAHGPYYDGNDCGREEQAGDTPEGALAHRGQGILGLAGATLADGFEGAHIAGDEGEDGDTDAALGEDPEEGVLEEARSLAYGIGGGEEFAIKGANQMGEDDRCGRQTAEPLWRRSAFGGGRSRGEQGNGTHINPFDVLVPNAHSLMRALTSGSCTHPDQARKRGW